jgi:hypothetical protein
VLLKEKRAKRFADLVGERSESEGQALEIKQFCEAGFHPKDERREARHINKFGGI